MQAGKGNPGTGKSMSKGTQVQRALGAERDRCFLRVLFGLMVKTLPPSE